jgi:heme/copper-type cytochrome/quinol oxidase subunit 2
MQGFNASGDLKQSVPWLNKVLLESAMLIVLFIVLFIAAVVLSFILRKRAEKADRDDL